MKKLKDFYSLEDVFDKGLLEYIESFRKRTLERVKNNDPEIIEEYGQDLETDALIMFLEDGGFTECALTAFSDAIIDGQVFIDEKDLLYTTIYGAYLNH